jgi:hypothetical protein
MGSAMRRGRLAAKAAAIVLAAASVCTAAAGAGVIDVPFLPQGEDLCGGAAAAMVMRYWGARDVYSEAFASLVDRSAGGIRTGVLAADLRQRGWTALDGPGDLASLTLDLGRGRPVIALIEVRRDRFHYVVVIGASADEIVVHDPARGPSRVMKPASFDAAWSKAGRWMLTLLPPPQGAVSVPTHKSESESESVTGVMTPGHCGVDAAVQRANDGDSAGARSALEAATVACAGDAAPWRELAGLDAVDRHWEASAEHARRAVDIDPGDDYAWRILATAEYVQHHDLAALDAWNHVGEPVVDLVNLTGLQDTRYDVAARAMGIAPGQTLTREALRLAERRAGDVPAVSLARVAFHPVEKGRAQVDAALVERDRAPDSYPAWIAIGLGAAANREVAASFANPSGGGDVLSASWRWWANRPMIAASYSAPAPAGLGGGVWRIDASRETQTFSPGLVETRTRAVFGVNRWVTSRTRVGIAAGIESWSSRGRTPSIAGRVEFWPVADRLSVAVTADRWRDFGTAAGAIRWRSRAANEGVVWTSTSGYQFATNGAPASLWPGADTGHARDVLLRAHPLLEDGVIEGTGPTAGVFGRKLAFGSAEVQRWQTVGKWPIRIAPAAFVDVARATDGFGGASTPGQIDAGAGLRVSMLGFGVLRIDAAHGLRDGRNALSIAFVR